MVAGKSSKDTSFGFRNTETFFDLNRCEYSLVDARLVAVIIHFKLRKGFQRFPFPHLKDLMLFYVLLTFDRFFSNHKRFLCQSLKFKNFVN